MAQANHHPARPHQVLWVPALPSEGSLSMDRYWVELEKQRREHADADAGSPGLQIRSALPHPPASTRRRGRLRRFWEKYLVYPVTVRRKAARANVVHLLDHACANVLLQVPAGVPKMVTVHDLAPLRIPGDLTPGQQQRFHRAMQNLSRADLLLAVSQHTQREIAGLLHCDAARVRVFPMGVDLAQFQTPQLPPLPDWDGRTAGRQVILSVGSVSERKNLALLPEFLARLKAMGRAVVLVRVGDALPEPLAADLRAVLGHDGLWELGKVPSEQLAGVYQRAALLFFPSRLEGFGLPVLEAMAAGCPVVCSNTSSLPEVGGDVPAYFDPADVGAAVPAAASMLERGERCRESIAAGRRRAAAFSWKAHYTRLLDVYDELLAAKPRATFSCR